MSNQRTHLNYLAQCLDLAKAAVESGNHPFGALLVKDDRVVATSKNEVVVLHDVTAHAELRLIQKAQVELTAEELKDCTLYTSTEPCAMCSGAIYWAGISKVVYGCSTSQLFNIVKSGLFIKAEEVFFKGTRKIEVLDYSHEKKFIKIHENFWR
ncbi:MAG: tRNA-specific adenosine deaminase [Halobacteriovoraceae bacterium]|nr:tRNA-specific adenosine deaminase [Halobacteriovoraceae bacterium]|tara:strand:- start:50530 stop:50991 length:462 start_codon:yes stop_codon:yes gene_type:complete